jgi:hypothetical protein
MYSVEADGARRVFVIAASGEVLASEVRQGAQELKGLLQDATPGFAVLADFRGLEAMQPETAQQIGAVMDQFAEKEVAMVIRVIPDRYKDVGLNILSQFHYSPAVEVASVTTLAEAIALDAA